MANEVWPRFIEKGERVEVVFDGYLSFGKKEWGAVVGVDVEDKDDPQYLVRLDREHRDVPGVADEHGALHVDETWAIRWFSWEFIRPLNLLEQIADAAR